VTARPRVFRSALHLAAPERVRSRCCARSTASTTSRQPRPVRLGAPGRLEFLRGPRARGLGSHLDHRASRPGPRMSAGAVWESRGGCHPGRPVPRCAHRGHRVPARRARHRPPTSTYFDQWGTEPGTVNARGGRGLHPDTVGRRLSPPAGAPASLTEAAEPTACSWTTAGSTGRFPRPPQGLRRHPPGRHDSVPHEVSGKRCWRPAPGCSRPWTASGAPVGNSGGAESHSRHGQSCATMTRAHGRAGEAGPGMGHVGGRARSSTTCRTAGLLLNDVSFRVGDGQRCPRWVDPMAPVRQTAAAVDLRRTQPHGGQVTISGGSAVECRSSGLRSADAPATVRDLLRLLGPPPRRSARAPHSGTSARETAMMDATTSRADGLRNTR